MATPAGGAMSMKLQIVVDTKNNKVLFAEAQKEFVDFIFHLLALPLGAVHRVLQNTWISGSIGTLREGLNHLDAEYIQSPGKQYLLDALEAPFHGKQNRLMLPQTLLCSRPVTIFACYCGSNSAVHEPCKSCRSLSKFSFDGYVKGGLVTFMVLDDLRVRPVTATSFFSVMKELSMKDIIDATEKREVTFGPNEAINLLNASLNSETVLTDVFLAGAH